MPNEFSLMNKFLIIHKDSLHDHHPLLNNLTLDDDDFTIHPYNHFISFIKLVILFIIGIVNVLLSSPHVNDNDIEVKNKKKIFQDFMNVSKISYVLEFTHWLFLPNISSLLLNSYMWYRNFCSKHNLHISFLSALEKVVHNNIIVAPCTTNCFTYLSTKDKEIMRPLYKQHEIVQMLLTFSQNTLFLLVVTTTIFIILTLKWINAFLDSSLPRKPTLIQKFCTIVFTNHSPMQWIKWYYQLIAENLSTLYMHVVDAVKSLIKLLIVNIIDATTNYNCLIIHSIKHISMFDGVTHCCNDIRLERILSLMNSNQVNSCIANETNQHLLHNDETFPSHDTSHDTVCSSSNNFILVCDDELVTCEEETTHRDQSHWTQDLHCEFPNAVNHEDDTELVVCTLEYPWLKDELCVITTSPSYSSDVPNHHSPSCNNHDCGVSSTPYCVPSVLHHYCSQPAQYRNADHAFAQDEKCLVTGNSISSSLSPDCASVSINLEYIPYTLDETICTQHSVNDVVNKFYQHCMSIGNDDIDVSPCQEESIEDDIQNLEIRDTKGLEGDDDSNDDDDDVGCEEFHSVAQPCVVSTNDAEYVLGRETTSCFKNTLVYRQWCCNDESEGLVIGIFSSNCVSLTGQAHHLYIYSDTERPVVDGVSKPKVSNNQPHMFEDTTSHANRLNTKHSVQQIAPTLSSWQRQQSTTSNDDTLVEADGPLRIDAGLQSAIDPERQNTKEGATSNYCYPTCSDPQFIREKPKQSRQLPSTDTHCDLFCDTKFEEDVPIPYEEVKQKSKAKTTFLQHEVEDKSKQLLKQDTVDNDHVINTNQSVASNVTSSKVKSLPKRSCIVMGTTQYPLTSNLLAHPHMDHFFVKERSEIKPGHFLAKLVLRHHYLIE